MNWGTEKKLKSLRAAVKVGSKVAKARLDSRPQPTPTSAFFWNGFQDLAAGRGFDFGSPLALTTLEIVAYLDLMCFPQGASRIRFFRIVRELDAKFLSIAAKNKPKGK